MDAFWLKRQFEHSPKKSKAQLARILGLKPPAISKILNGTRQIKAKEYHLMREYFGLSEDTNLENPRLKSISDLISLAGQGFRASSNEHRLSNVFEPSRNLKIFKIKESAMEPDFKKGDDVLIDISVERIASLGVFALSDGYGIMIRDCKPISNSETLDIRISARASSFQAQTIRESDIKILGRVVAKIDWL